MIIWRWMSRRLGISTSLLLDLISEEGAVLGIFLFVGWGGFGHFRSLQSILIHFLGISHETLMTLVFDKNLQLHNT